MSDEAHSNWSLAFTLTALIASVAGCQAASTASDNWRQVELAKLAAGHPEQTPKASPAVPKASPQGNSGRPS